MNFQSCLHAIERKIENENATTWSSLLKLRSSVTLYIYVYISLTPVLCALCMHTKTSAEFGIFAFISSFVRRWLHFVRARIRMHRLSIQHRGKNEIYFASELDIHIYRRCASYKHCETVLAKTNKIHS